MVFFLFLGLIVLVITGFSVCANVPAKLMSGGDLAAALWDKGWIPVDFPGTLLGPGSIVSITETGGIKPRGK